MLRNRVVNRRCMSHQPDLAAGASAPELSVVLITPDTFATIRRTVRCLARQNVHDRIELVVIAPRDAAIEIDDELRSAFAAVRIVPMASLIPTGPARAAGIRNARAPVVAFAEEHCFPAPGWAEALLRAHREPWTVVGPAIRNANPDTKVSWSDLLIGYGPWLAPTHRREVEFLPGHNSSYKRAALLEYGDALDDLMEAETVLQWDLRRKGHRFLLEPAAQASHTNFSLWSSWIPVMFYNGRAFADVRSARWSFSRRLVFCAGAPLIPLVRLTRIVGNVRRTGRSWPFVLGIVPALSVGLAIDAVGQMLGYMLGAGDAHEKMAAYEWHRLKHTRRGEEQPTDDWDVPQTIAP
jgi:hypothetical protein